MKKQKLLFIVLIVGTLKVSAQVSTPFNFGIATNYVGWNAAQAFPLQIRHNAAQPINFFTSNTQRMTITPTGLVGIGNGANAPISLLHVNSNGHPNIAGQLFRTTGPSNVNNIWRMHTGPGNGTERFRILIPADSVHTRITIVDTNGTMQLQTGALTRIFVQRAAATPLYGVETKGFIGVGTNSPASPLHIVGRERLNDVAGWRRALTISQGSICFSGVSAADTNFFMAYQSGLPNGNFYAGTAASLNLPDSDVNYAYTIGSQTPIGGGASGNPLNSAQYFKNLLVSQVDPDIDSIVASTERRLGVNTLKPQNIVHINTLEPDPVPGNSGLRFEDLTSQSDIVTNQGDGVLALDSLGNVIYVPDGGGADDQTLSGSITGDTLNLTISDGNTINLVLPPAAVEAENGTSVNMLGRVVLGQDYGQAGNPAILLNDREIPLDTNEINFSGPGTLHISQGSANLNTNAALDINTESNANNTALYVRNRSFINDNQTSKGVLVDMSFKPQNSDYAGVQIGVVGNNESHTGQEIPNKAFLLKTYGSPLYTLDPADSTTRVAFGIEATGRVGVNVPNDEYARATFSIQDHFNNPNISNPYSGKVASRALLINNVNANNGDSYGIESYSRNNNTPAVGVMAIGEGTATSSGNINSGTGVHAIGRANSGTNGTTRSIGVNAEAFAANGVLGSFGVSTTATGGVNNVGLRAFITNNGTFNAAVYGSSLGNGFPSGFYAGYFDGAAYVNGNLHVQGSITASGTITDSDQRFKTNVEDLSGALEKINALQPRTFDYDTVNYADFNFESDHQMGLIAQEVEEVLPDIVSNHIRSASYDSLGNEVKPEIQYKGIEYSELIPLLIAGVQEQQNEIEEKDSLITSQQTQIDDLNARLSQLESCLSALLPSLCEANQMAIQQTPQEIQQQLKQKISVTLSDRNTIVLNQNVPNPFAESTVIEYSIPNNVQQAQIHFYDANGKLIQSVNLTERGKGELTVFASDLSSGIYTYSLVTDGKIVSTKKMMKN
jgi:hypothetical protein